MSMFGQIMLLVPRSALAMPLRHCILVESVLLFFFCLSCLCSKISFHCVVFENNVVVSVKAVDNLLSYGLLLEPTRTIANK